MTTTTLKRAATTFTTAARNVDHVEDLRAGLELVESLAKELDRRKRELRAKAIDAGLAKYDVTQRESAPAKAAYIKLHGQEAFDANKTVGSVNKFIWID
jgi:chemotaxis protein histidine kinase CheA